MNSINYLQQIGIMFTNYVISNKVKEYELDGRQQLVIGILASSKINLLAFQWRSVYPDLKTYGIIHIPWCMGVITAIATTDAKAYLARPEGEQNRFYSNLCKLIAKVGDAGNVGSKYINIVIEVAAGVSFVAMLVLGFPVPGCFGLAGLFLIAVKRSGYMPSQIDRFLEPILVVSQVVVTITMPMHILLRIIQIFFYVNYLLIFLNQHPRLMEFLPETMRNPLPGKHVVCDSDKLTQNNFDSAEIMKETMDNSSFVVNFSSIYTKETGSLLPQDFDKELDKKTAKQLFQLIDDRLIKEGIILDEGELSGIDKLKNGIIYGRFGDTTPPNLEVFQKIMKAELVCILNDEQGFAMKIAELASIGNSCTEGWLREVLFMLNPNTKNSAWAVHHELAVLRGEIAKEMVRGIDRGIKRITNNRGIDLSAFGGANDVHLSNAFQAGIWARFRTYEGELHQEVYSKSLLDVLLIKSLKMDNKRKVSVIERIMFFKQMAKVHPAMAFFISLFVSELKKIDDHYTADIIVDSVYDAIKPQYHSVDGEAVVEQSRKIQWEAIQGWMADLSENNKKIAFFDSEGWSEKWVIKDEHKNPYLTKDGVRLLLWALGILSPC